MPGKVSIETSPLIGLIILFFLLVTPKISMAEKENIYLPQPTTKGKVSLEEAIAKRRSQRSFASGDLSLEQISQLLWAGQGITEKKGQFSFRAAPSAGALYPMELYILTKDGLFHYVPERHILERLSDKDLRRQLSQAALGQAAINEAPFDMLICAVYSRVTAKYGQRGRMYVDIEAGHVAENIHLQAVALGLGSVPIGAFDNQAVKKACSLPDKHEPLYIIPVGYSD
ncbi:MAG: SagB/ThcOx family dehydrogenase [Candidatus Omnitrophota bacterium]